MTLRGESHMSMNLVTGLFLGGTGFLLLNTNVPQEVKNVVTIVKDFLFDSGDIPFPVFLATAIGLYLLGSLLPDIDTPYSTLGRIIYIPFEHRTWTHAIWIPLILLIAGIWIRLLFWLGLGIFFHDFWDSFSASGIHWFYPIKRKGRNKLRLYHTGQRSEYIFAGVAWGILLVYAVFILQVVYDIFNVFAQFI